ncbi:MAG: outer membrane beta-barrel protein [Gammaproteobacteria bacterium]|jgi:OOP family OmpA-OmpF porin
MKSVIASIALGVLVAPAWATDDQGFYTSIGTGGYRLEMQDFDDVAPTIDLLGGYDFNQYFAVEGTYRRLLESTDHVQGTRIDIDGDVWELSAKASYPFTSTLSGYGRLGWSAYEFIGKAFVADERIVDDHTGNDATWALGANYLLNDRFSLRGEYSQILIDHGDAQFVSLYMSYSF